MAAVRHNRPTILVYGGTIRPGVRQVDCPSLGFKKGDPVNLADAYECFGEFSVVNQIIDQSVTLSLSL